MLVSLLGYLLGQLGRHAPLAQVPQDAHLSQALILQTRGCISFGKTLVVQVAGFLQFREDRVHVLRALRAAAEFFAKLA